MTNILHRRRREWASVDLTRQDSDISTRTSAADHFGWQICSLGRILFQPAENEAGLRIAWNNTWWTMALSPCHGDCPALDTASAAALNAGAESAGSEDAPGILRARASARANQRRPSIKATIRSVRRRADGMMKNAVAAATGQAMKYALAHWIRNQQRQYQSGLGVHAHLSPGHGGLWRNPSSFADAATLVRCIGAALGMGLVLLNASYSLTIAPGAQERPDGRANL
jgi:hypothetical protein